MQIRQTLAFALLVALPACSGQSSPQLSQAADAATVADTVVPESVDQARDRPGTTDLVADADQERQSDGASSSEVGGDARQLQPIRVFRGQGSANLRFVGARLEQYEGAIVTFAIGSPSNPGQALGSGQVRIVDGSFEAFFPGVLRPAYLPKEAHIDVDGSGACEPGEPVFSDFGLYLQDVTLTVEPGAVQLRPATTGMCGRINNFPIE